MTEPPPPTEECPWLERCGGCDLADLDIHDQHIKKSVFVQRALGLEDLPPVVASPRATAHRARIRLAIEGRDLGYRAARSHDLVRIDSCAIAREEIEVGLTRLRQWIDPDCGSILGDVEIRSDGSRVVYAFTSLRRRVPKMVREVLGELGDVALDGKRVAGDPNLTLDVLGYPLRAGPSCFYQVNLEANLLLVQHVVDLIKALEPTRVLDLFCGIGNLSVPIAGTGVPVIGVEREGRATEDLRRNAGDLDVSVLRLPVERFDPSREFFDVAVLDPPRGGAPGVVQKLLLNRPQALVYVSCHAPSLARDLRPALDAGYRVTSTQCFDLFPDTRHVETVLVAVR